MPDKPASFDSTITVGASGSRWRRWIFPSFAKQGWTGRLRWILLRLIGYYLIIVAGIGLFQRRLIYLPRRADSIPARAAGFPSGQIHDVSYQTHDGLVLHGWHVLPRDTSCETQANGDATLVGAEHVVLFCPENGGNRSERGAECRSFTDLGAHVFLFDYRGYGENPGSPGEEDSARDLRSAWDYVREKGVPSERIVIFGPWRRG